MMANSDYNTVNNIIAQLPTKTAAAPGTLVIDGVEGYDQIDLAAAEAKYWTVSHKYNMDDFNKKIVNGEMLNYFAKKMNNKIKEAIGSLDSTSEEIETNLTGMINSHTENTTVHITDAERTAWNTKADMVEETELTAMLTEIFGTTEE